jgi:hypothetical protein
MSVAQTTRSARPIVTALELSYPPAAPAIEVGYQIICNLDTMRDVCHIASSPKPFDKKVSDVTKLAAKKLASNLVAQTIWGPVDRINRIAVHRISGELAKKHVFSELARGLGLQDDQSKILQEFFEDAMLKLLEKGEEKLEDIGRSSLERDRR